MATLVSLHLWPTLRAMVFSERARRCEAAEALEPFWLHLSHQWGKGFVLVKEWHCPLSQLVHELIQYASSTYNMPGPALALESQWELFWNMMTRKWRWKLMLFLVRTSEHWHRLPFKLYWCSETEFSVSSSYSKWCLPIKQVSRTSADTISSSFLQFLSSHEKLNSEHLSILGLLPCP